MAATIRAYQVILFFGFLISMPLVIFGFPSPTHDGILHEIWFSNFCESWWSGGVYPRWMQEMNGGLGSPVFFFYPPIPYLITCIIDPLVPDQLYKYRELGFGAALATVASGFAVFSWLRTMSTKTAATIAAILYMGMPYHLAWDLHTRGAYAEYWAFVWMPLVLMFVRKTSRETPSAFLGIAIAYALLIMTHLPTTLMFSWIPVAYAVLLSAPARQWKKFVAAIGGMALGIGLAAVYLVPAMLTQDNVSMGLMRTGHYQYDQRFLAYTYEELAWPLSMVLLGICGWVLTKLFSPDDSAKRESLFWMIVTIGATCMVFSISKPVYELIPPLQLLQFPWRFNAVVCVAVAALLGPGVQMIQKPFTKRKLVLTLTVIVLVGMWVPESYPLIMDSTGNQQNPLTGRKVFNWGSKEYTPRWTEAGLGEIRELIENDPDLKFARARIVEGEGVASVESWESRSIVLRIDAATDVVAEVRQFYYPGWAATTTDGIRLDVKPATRLGLVWMTVPRGAHRIELDLERTAPELAGEVISLFSVGAFAVAATVFLTRSRRRRKHGVAAQRLAL